MSPLDAQFAMDDALILVTGATGYVGGRLVPCLLDAGYRVRCFVRDAERLQGRDWVDDVEIVEGDVLDYSTLPAALEGVDAAYYLIHSLSAGEDEFAELDRQAATHFGRAAAEAGVDRIIYLGGIEPKGARRSPHLASRLETGDYLRRSGTDVTELRAAVIVGSGSLSFELIRYLTERVPVMVCPRWVRTPTQPIAIRNVLQYLVAALETPESRGRTIEIGGADVLTYRDMFDIYARVRGLRRLLVDVPFLTPRLSSRWIGLVTPLTSAIARPLVEGLDNEVVVGDPGEARRLFPDVRPLSYETAVRLALRRFQEGPIESTWHSALSSSLAPGRIVEELEQTEGMIKEVRHLKVDATPDAAFDVVASLGGETGWLYANALWRLRGFIDLLFGGVGYRRTRRHPTDLRAGDAVDFWRVEVVERPRVLRLRAEMRVSGKAWLQFEITPPEDAPEGRTCITQTAFYEPKGLFGLLYWYAMYVPHRFIFPGMLARIGHLAEMRSRTQPTEANGARRPAAQP